ncbi:head GIN domain-containing protein [Parabacteroides pacaensis]|uniref:head GIN domain-containing protein n=1 Tax=Parabacteroides pacaensis TaxID=2086575 RepID=UPI000D0E8B2E|nr:head GIN domain-containing protein [Parabacteroides pacaensis]
MKLKTFLLLTALFMGITSLSAKTVRGNGKIVIKEISVPEYDEIEVNSQNILYNNSNVSGLFRRNRASSGSLTFNYSQKDAPAFLQVGIDENLLPHLKIKVEGKRLYVEAKDIQIQPTRMEITSHSKKIRSVSLIGSMDINLIGYINSEILDVNLAGSGDIKADDLIAANRINVYLKGSGDINLLNVSCNELNGRVAGSGDIRFRGEALKGYYEVAGSGDLSAYDCPVTNLECLVKGSGDIRANATGTLRAEVRGSGDIHYTGNASVNATVKGSGDITKR